MATPLEIAGTMLGKREVPDRAALQDYLTTGGANLDPATTAWCAAFVNATLKQSGMTGTGSNLARSFLNYGEGVDTPTKGDIAVFSRGDPNGPYGHVGFFEGYGPDGKIRVLGGNQGDSVSVAEYGPERLLGFRRPSAGGQSAPAVDPIGEVIAANNAPKPVMGTMAPVAPQAASQVPVGTQALASGQPQPASRAADIFGMMAAAPQQQSPFSPVDIRGPTPQQANALSSLLQTLKARMA